VPTEKLGNDMKRAQFIVPLQHYYKPKSYKRRNILLNESVIQVRDFRKIYGDIVAVDGISFEVQRGEIFGL